ncbi:DUF4181 domain-containing protein [Cohnella thailandensis]|uniref:DUF4181 domain-containing protein n=1 Tax=Cohnella thailandensis TaxID=557557 RepID=UPI003CCA0E11
MPNTIQLVMLLIIILALIQIPLKKYLFAGKSEETSDTDVRKINWWLRGILVIITLSIYLFVLDTTDDSKNKWFWLITFLIGRGLDVFIEWKYLKGSKDFLISLILLIIGIVYFCVFIF